MTKRGKIWYPVGMNGKLQAGILSASMLVSSCAYVQTHKNVEEQSTYYEGKVLSTENVRLYRQDGKWYLAAERAKFRLTYPNVHDEVFRRNMTEPKFKLLELDEQIMYHAISSHAAEILQRRDGYFKLDALAEEIQRTPGEWLEELPGAQQHVILAEIAGSHKYYIKQRRVPEKTPIVDKALGTLDFIVVDIPATVAYNVAIPFMAPFVFFYEFSQEQ